MMGDLLGIRSTLRAEASAAIQDRRPVSDRRVRAWKLEAPRVASQARHSGARLRDAGEAGLGVLNPYPASQAEA